MKRLSGMVALVSGAGGGATGGIGAAIACGFAAEGARVLVNDLTPASAQATCDRIAAMGGQAQAFVGSVAEAGQADAMVDAAVGRFGGLDILVNNAGIGWSAAVERMTDDEWERILAVNLDGPFRLSRAAVRVMRPRGFGRIVNISSVAGIRIGYLSGAAYTASKSGLLGFTRHLAVEVAAHGITVNAILPGMTATPLFRSHAPDATIARLASTIPAGRLAAPDDMVGLAVFFASRPADYITGTAIPMDGGLSLLPGNHDSYGALSNKDTG